MAEKGKKDNQEKKEEVVKEESTSIKEVIVDGLV